MALKKIGILILFSLTALSKIFSQQCGSLDRFIKYKSRKYYLLDSVDVNSFSITTELFHQMRSQDTTLVKEIIEKGKKAGNYKIFQQKGVLIKETTFDQFVELPRDSVLLTKREVRLKEKYDKLLKSENALIIAERSHKKIDKIISKKKYIELQEKILTRNPYLFVVYGIYKYKSYTLIVYGTIRCTRCKLEFNYEICNDTTE